MDFAEIEDSFERIVRRDASELPSDPETDFFSSVLDDDVKKALESLPYDYRMVVVLADLEDFTGGALMWSETAGLKQVLRRREIDETEALAFVARDFADAGSTDDVEYAA